MKELARATDAHRQEVTIRTGVWYNDRPVTLVFPTACQVTTHWPDTPAPLSDAELKARVTSPVGQPPIRELARGRHRPVIIVDDLSRPTPVSRVMPVVLEEFEQAGISASAVRVLVATGTHGHQNPHALASKLGNETMNKCRVLVHNDLQRCRLLGRTSFGTPVHPNRELLDSDLVIGIGGVYPQHSTGFGGGAKLALGVMERRTIRHLHFRHGSVGGTYNIENDFRRDLGEIARMIGYRTKITLHIDAAQQVVSAIAGDFEQYYRDAAAFSRARYDAPAPADADVVVANGYPSDISYTFTRKGLKPIHCAPPTATRIVVASNHEGIGLHGLFQQGLSARFEAYRRVYNRVRIMSGRQILQKIVKRLAGAARKKRAQIPAATTITASPILLYQPPGAWTELPSVDGVVAMSDWSAVIARILDMHRDCDPIRVHVYPCSSLQCIDALDLHSATDAD